MAPVSRLPALDILRGIAVLGTLATNVWVFMHPAGLWGELYGPLPEGLSENILRQLSTGKFLGLLSIMFGVGLAMQQRAAEAAGQRWPGHYTWRAVLLFLDGLLNYYLVIEFDVLMGYAISGLVVAWLLRTGERSQRTWMLGLAMVHFLLLTLLALAMLAFPLTDTAASPAAFARSMDWNPYRDGSWWDLVRFRAEHVLDFRLIEPVMILPMTVALFLLGATLFRSGVFDPHGATLRKRLLVLGAAGWALDMAIGVFAADALWLYTRWGTAVLVSLGILALVAGFYLKRPVPGWLGRRLSEVGRVALSGYVLQNLLASAVCYGWGFGLAGRVAESQRVGATVLLYVALCPLVMLAAHLWLRHFQRGPLEMLWNVSHWRLVGGPAQPAGAA